MGHVVASRDVFVGRQDELGLVSAALEDARMSRPRIVVIEGEPGIGKTAFVRQFLARDEDVVVLEVSGDESESGLEYGVVSQLLRQVPAELGLGSLNERLSEGSAVTSFAVGGELLTMLGSVQEQAPVVLVVDDAHWVDPASASALLFVLRRLHGDRVLVLIVSRPGALDQSGLSWARLLNDPERAQRVTLGGLNDREIGLMASSLGYDSVTVATADRLRQHTGGNPLYVRGLLHELPADALRSERDPLPAPHSFAATVLARLASLSAESQELVAAASVAGPRCPTSLAGAVAGLSDPAVALEEALAADLLTVVPMAIPEEVAFPHPLIRAAVYEDLSPARRRALHLACAKLTSGPTSLAHRVVASRGADDALAEELTKTAEADIAAGRLTAAVRHLLWASQVACTREERETALLRAVDCLVLAGDGPAAQRRRDEVLACGDSPRRSFVIGELTALAGRLPDAEALLLDVIDRLAAETESELAGRAIVTLAAICAFMDKGDDATLWARRALEVGGSPTVEMSGRQALAMGLMSVGKPRESIATLDSVSASKIDLGAFEAEMLAARGNLKTWWGDLSSATDDLSAVTRWSRSGGAVRNLPNAYAALAQAEYHLGRWGEAVTHAEVGVSLSEDADRLWDLPFVHAVAGHLHAGRGNWSLAAEHVAAAQRVAEFVPLPLNRYYSCIGAANLAWTQGDWEAVLDALTPLHGGATGRVNPGRGQPFRWLMEAEALVGIQRYEDAERTLDGLDSALSHSPQDVARVGVWRLRGMLDQALNRPKDARVAFANGQEAAKTARSSFAEGALELAYGQFLRKTGSRRAATKRLQLARELFERLGARPFLDRCDAELAACGVRPQQAADDDYGLTAREQVVATLVASGKSNREVAAELYLSTKAVEYHLANIFTKVGIRSRHQLASHLAGSASEGS